MARKDEEEPKVEVFGDDFHLRHHHYHSGGMFWGLLFLLIGLTFLFNNLGLLSWNIWPYLWVFWPVILIFIGMQIILGRNIVSRLIISLLAILVFIYVFLYALYQVHSPVVSSFPPALVNFLQTTSQYQGQ